MGYNTANCIKNNHFVLLKFKHNQNLVVVPCVYLHKHIIKLDRLSLSLL